MALRYKQSEVSPHKYFNKAESTCSLFLFSTGLRNTCGCSACSRASPINRKSALQSRPLGDFFGNIIFRKDGNDRVVTIVCIAMATRIAIRNVSSQQ